MFTFQSVLGTLAVLEAIMPIPGCSQVHEWKYGHVKWSDLLLQPTDQNAQVEKCFEWKLSNIYLESPPKPMSHRDIRNMQLRQCRGSAVSERAAPPLGKSKKYKSKGALGVRGGDTWLAGSLGPPRATHISPIWRWYLLIYVAPGLAGCPWGRYGLVVYCNRPQWGRYAPVMGSSCL
jgi:hypothetical protein